MDALPQLATKKLKYSIFKYSSSSSTYLPENILEDKPSDQSSRWSTEANTPPQYVILKLDKPAIVTRITFGKYEKTHSCNLKHFKVYGMAMSKHEDLSNNDHPDFANDTNTLLLIDSGLKNDTIPETFKLKHVINDQYLPCKYIKITPLECWKPSFNFSIWYVALEGDDNPEIIEAARSKHDEIRQREAIRLCLKHLRQHNYTEAFEQLQKQSHIELEHPMLTQLHEALVKSGNYERSEEVIRKAIQGGLFDKWMDNQLPTPKWSPLILPEEFLAEELSPSSPSPLEDGRLGIRNNNNEVMIDDLTSDPDDSNKSSLSSTPSGCPSSSVLPTHPGCRGGHQMVMDSENQLIYMFGGWDGNRDLADFWAFDVTLGKWKLLSMDTEVDGGPSPRSCHKMVLDTVTNQIYILGRYLERGLRDRAQNIKSDFYKYDLHSNKWTLLSEDTSTMGGPMLIFDHQMCIDSSAQKIYVFGGQSLFISMTEGQSVSVSEKMYSGLYEYDIGSNAWKKCRDDITSSHGASITSELKSRSSHSMLFHSGLRKLFIFGGQRKGSEYLNDFFSYSVDTDEVDIISTGTCPESAIPAVGHTQRATIDMERHEIHVMTGLNKDKEKSNSDQRKSEENKVTNSFWVYNILMDKWTCFYRNDNNSSAYWNKMQSEEPRPRYAHQLVYDEKLRVHYMFGGNPGGKQGKEDRLRLGDFWKLELLRPTRAEVLRKCTFLIRQCKFSELVAEEDAMAALKYLHSSLASVVDHHNPQEEKEYQLLASELFKTPQKWLAAPNGKKRNKRSREGTSVPTNCQEESSIFKLRSGLYDKLASHFPESMTHPRGDLIDLIPYASSLSNDNSLAIL